jgi:hypothetical protein
MTINEQYKRAYEAVEYNKFLDKSRARRKAAQNEFSERIAAEQKRRQPRRRKNFDPLPDNWVDALRDELLVKCGYELDERVKDKMRTERDETLERLAPQVTFFGDFAWWIVSYSSTSSYSSQGYGMHSYAKAAVKPLAAMLDSLGIITSIRWKMLYKGTGRFSCGDGGDYQLWANCPEWMADAAKHLITFETISKAVGRATNVCALYPGLPVDYLDKHYAITK